MHIAQWIAHYQTGLVRPSHWFAHSLTSDVVLFATVFKHPQPNLGNWVFHVRSFRHISVRLSDRSKITQHKINFVKNCPPVGFELTTSRSSVPCSPNWAREESVGDFWSEFSFVPCTTLHVGLCLFLESIEHDFVKALMIPIHNQIVT